MIHTEKGSRAINKLYVEILAHDSKTVCFTSPSFKEGITTIACATAAAAATFGRKILYCDFGNYNTSLSKAFNIEFNATQENILKQCVENIKFLDNHGFSILPLPGPRPYDLSLIEKETLRVFFDELKKQYDLIFIDSHSFNKYQPFTISSRYLSEVADVTVLIVLSGVTTKEDLEETIKEMKHIGTNLLGCVMNDIEYPRLVDELCKLTEYLEKYFPAFAQSLRKKLRNSAILNIENE